MFLPLSLLSFSRFKESRYLDGRSSFNKVLHLSDPGIREEKGSDLTTETPKSRKERKEMPVRDNTAISSCKYVYRRERYTCGNFTRAALSRFDEDTSRANYLEKAPRISNFIIAIFCVARLATKIKRPLCNASLSPPIIPKRFYSENTIDIIFPIYH